MARMAETPQEVVIVRVKRHDHELEGAHGGVWKLAYADFVTAMMAFFLLMWLVNATTEEQRDGISAYFNPMAVATGASGTDGLMAGRTADTEGSMTAPNGEGERPHPVSAPPSVSTIGTEKRRPQGAEEGRGVSAFKDSAAQHEPPLTAQLPSEPMKIGETAPVAVAAFNDPFAEPSEKMAQLYQDERAPAELDAAAFEEHEGEKSAQKIEPFDGLEAGTPGKAALSESELLAHLEQGEQLEGLKQKLLENLRELMEKKGLNENIRLNIEEEGLRIQIMDDNKFSMFAVGSSDVTAETAAIMQAVAEVLEDVPNGLMITGHTDALPYKGTRNYSNWELSADRANAARRQLLLNGLAPERVLRVEGHGDRRPLVEEDTLDPRNRRISILVLAK